MTYRTPQEVTEDFFNRIATAEDVHDIAELVSENVDWLVAGNTQMVPWIGRKHGRKGAAEFYAQIREQLSSERFEINDILFKDKRVIAIGQLASRVIKTGKLIETEFVLDMYVEDGLITRFRMFEDSHAVSEACI
ncbi:nuclear transport factor 2 family protein [Pantoea sp. EA-12]|jgi:Ketosteroid isomerase-related protein|uniref:nuclear transport factor 2 family protein n=1 Tax=Pantoea sp. EA-12 TaxID=3043303 RepID=UPI0024B4B835|nr:nuclear transport factor 2 family protein [Pantoea sp. EA-12]MDI9219649.1 nuclear transport factor 2 family protein [Pantoea sp. EA-12]